MDESLFKKISPYVSKTPFIATGIIYLTGYLKLSWLLYVIRVHVIPTDIYPISAIFFSGLTACIIALLVPILLCFIGYFLGKYCVSKFLVVIIATCSSLLIFKSNMFLANTGFEYIPSVFFWGLKYKVPLSITVYLLATTIILCAYFSSKDPKLKMIISTTIFIIMWLMFMLVSHGYELKNAIYGAQLKTVSQDSGVFGIIATEYPISGASTPRTDMAKSYFVTRGLLLYRAEGTYYFTAEILAQLTNTPNFPQTNLCIIPQNRVIGFYETRNKFSPN